MEIENYKKIGLFKKPKKKQKGGQGGCPPFSLTFVTNNYNAILNLSSSIIELLIFATGLGRYRIILFYSAFSLLKAIFNWLKVDDLRILYFFYLPILVITLYVDIQKGQFYPIFPKLPFWITVLILVVAELSTREYVKKMLWKLSDGEIFSVCPSCKYDNRNIVTQCSNCSFRKGIEKVDEKRYEYRDSTLIYSNLNKEIENYKKIGLFKKIPLRIFNLLGICENETILIYSRVFPFKSLFKNSIRLILNNIVLTSERIIFVDYYFFSSGWRVKEVFSYDEIVEVVATMKKLGIKKEPVIIIKTIKDSYELFFRTLFPYRGKIKGIIDCIKKRNPNIPVTMDIGTDSWKIDWQL